jgi:hypothetical protein
MSVQSNGAAGLQSGSATKNGSRSSETEATDTPVKRKGASPNRVTELRLKLLENGYLPIPTEGKHPAGKKWQERTDTNAEEIARWEEDGWFPNARNTGILTKYTPAIDIDILDPDAADAADDLVRERLADREGVILLRFGQRPKRAILLRTDVPFKKIQAVLTKPGGDAEEKIEILADGQQVVVAGIHPGTGQPYEWFGVGPLTVKREDLPLITEKEAHALVNDIVDLLVKDFGYAAKPRANGKNGRVHPKALEENISSGLALHDSNRDLAMSLLAKGETPEAVTARLRALMEEVPATERNDRWEARYDDIPRLVDGGVTWLEAERAKAAESLDKLLEEMNAEYSVAKIGGKTRVMEFEPDPSCPGCKVPVFQTLPDFRAFHHKHKVWTVEKGKPKLIGRGKWWLDHPERRQYSGVVYAPGIELGPHVYNLWQGFACEPKEGNCALYLEHTRKNVCAGNEEYYQYLLRKLAYTVQHPDRQGEIAVVLKGKEGTGKGLFVRIFGSLFGPHFKHISQPRHLTGNFNSLQQDCSVLFGDEVFWAGDRQHEGILKAIITEPTLQIERKCIDTITAPNRMTIFLSSNNAWVIPAGADARRFFVLDVGDAHKQDTKYFGALLEQMDNGGREALLHTLLNMDITGFRVWDVPQTAALMDQKQRSRHGVDALVEHMVTEGQLLEAHDLHPDIAVSSERSDHRKGFFKVAQSLFPGLKHQTWIVVQKTLKEEWGCTPWKDMHLRGLRFPPLPELRAKFDARHGAQAWEDPDADWRYVGDAGGNSP